MSLDKDNRGQGRMELVQQGQPLLSQARALAGVGNDYSGNGLDVL